jgi:hypothetical protein
MSISTEPETKLPIRITIRLDGASAQRLHALCATTGTSPSACIRQMLDGVDGTDRIVTPDMALNCRAMVDRLGDLRGELIACRRLIEAGDAFGDPVIALLSGLADAIDAARLLILSTISGRTSVRREERR